MHWSVLYLELSNGAFLYLEFLPHSPSSTHQRWSPQCTPRLCILTERPWGHTASRCSHLACPKQHRAVECHLNQAHRMIYWCRYIISCVVSLLYKCYCWSSSRQKWCFPEDFPLRTSNMLKQHPVLCVTSLLSMQGLNGHLIRLATTWDIRNS